MILLKHHNGQWRVKIVEEWEFDSRNECMKCVELLAKEKDKYGKVKQKAQERFYQNVEEALK